MDSIPESSGAAQRLVQFQLQGDAAGRYERWTVPFVTGPWVPALLDLAALQPGERVLDIATGTGVVARLAARWVAPGGTVTGVELNEGILALARRLPLPRRRRQHPRRRQRSRTRRPSR